MFSTRLFTATTLVLFGAVALAQENNERPVRRLRSLHNVWQVAEEPKQDSPIDKTFANREFMSRLLQDESMSM